MAVTLQRERDDLYRLEISGRLHKHDLDAVQRPLVEGIRRAGSVRLLVLLTNFLGWDDESNWRDLTFYVKYGDRLKRIAIVGDEKWRSQVLMFTAADLRAAPVEYFPPAERMAAEAWLGSGAVEDLGEPRR